MDDYVIISLSTCDLIPCDLKAVAKQSCVARVGIDPLHYVGVMDILSNSVKKTINLDQSRGLMVMISRSQF